MGEETVGGLLLAVTAGALGPLVHRVTTAAADGRIALNHLIGIRTRRTLASPEAWSTGHRAALPWTRRTAWATAAVAATSLVLALTDRPGAALVGGLAAMATVVGGLLLGVRAAHRAIAQASSASTSTS